METVLITIGSMCWETVGMLWTMALLISVSSFGDQAKETQKKPLAVTYSCPGHDEKLTTAYGQRFAITANGIRVVEDGKEDDAEFVTFVGSSATGSWWFCSDSKDLSEKDRNKLYFDKNLTSKFMVDLADRKICQPEAEVKTPLDITAFGNKVATMETVKQPRALQVQPVDGKTIPSLLVFKYDGRGGVVDIVCDRVKTRVQIPAEDTNPGQSKTSAASP